MYLINKKYCFFLLFLLFNFSGINSSFSQQSIGIGYNNSFYTYGLRDVQTYFHNYNHNHPDYKKPYDYNSFCRGIYTIYEISTFEFFYSNKHSIYESIGTEYDGTEFTRKFKCRLNTVGFGGDLSKDYRINPGVSVQIGNYCEQEKYISTDSISKFTDVYPSSGLFGGLTFLCDIRLLGEDSPVGISLRPYYEFQILRVIMEYDILHQTFYKLNNCGIIAIFKIRLE